MLQTMPGSQSGQPLTEQAACGVTHRLLCSWMKIAEMSMRRHALVHNAWCYNSGDSEHIMRRALVNGYRHLVFLMTKNHGRAGVTFRRQLKEPDATADGHSADANESTGCTV